MSEFPKASPGNFLEEVTLAAKERDVKTLDEVKIKAERATEKDKKISKLQVEIAERDKKAAELLKEIFPYIPKIATAAQDLGIPKGKIIDSKISSRYEFYQQLEINRRSWLSKLINYSSPISHPNSETMGWLLKGAGRPLVVGHETEYDGNENATHMDVIHWKGLAITESGSLIEACTQEYMVVSQKYLHGHHSIEGSSKAHYSCLEINERTIDEYWPLADVANLKKSLVDLITTHHLEKSLDL